MIFHVVFLFLSASGNLNSTLITGGLPDFAHPDTVIYRVATSHGKLSIYLRFPGLYDEATISDFNDVSNIAVDHLERAYQSRPILRFPVGHREPIAVYHLSRLGCFFEPVRPTPIDARDIIRTRLRELYDSISRLTARRMVERVGSLQSHSHPFERLADNLGGEAAAYDSVHGANLTSAGSELVFRQELPFVELVVDSLNRSIKRSNLDMSVLMDYFNWPILNSAVTRRSHPDEALLDGPDVISGSPMETSTTVNKTQFGSDSMKRELLRLSADFAN